MRTHHDQTAKNGGNFHTGIQSIVLSQISTTLEVSKLSLAGCLIILLLESILILRTN